MKTIKKYYCLLVCFIMLGSLVSCGSNDVGEDLSIDNGKLKLSFSTENGSLVDFQDLIHDYEFLDDTGTLELPWEVNFNESQDSLTAAPANFTYSKSGPLKVILKWSGFKGETHKDFGITAEVTLDEEKALSYWKISLDGTHGKQINSVVFPKISGLKNMGEEKLAVPTWMGQILDDPREYLSQSTKDEKKMAWEYPGPLSLQCLALYNPDKVGLYTAANDTETFRKSFSFTLDKSNNLTYRMLNYPSFDKEVNLYAPSYEGVIGSFKGDWITAAEQYREWGGAQKWSLESRFEKGLNPKWLEETALWVWNRGYSENVLVPAADLKQRLGLPVNVFWHWWHGCSYDEGFPEYLPPREGKESFVQAMKTARDKDINAIVYMNSFQWGNSTESWKTENASEYAVKDINGNMRTHSYNIFTGNSLTNMCMATQFWQDKYTSLSDDVVNTYGTSGVYMDQACMNRACYDSNHNHPLGGGNYWLKNFGKLTNQIRSKFSEEKPSILAGEGGAEGWMPYLNAFLTLQVSRERYAGVSRWETIPFFQAVYHQYAITYGNYSSLVTPPYDALWPEEFRPDNLERPLDPKFNKQFLMEQARSFVWGMQPTISNYHSFLASKRKEEIDYLMDIARVRYKGLKYMLYGKFLRAPKIKIPEEELNISKLSIYAGRKGKGVTAYKKEHPLVYVGAWKADDGNIGIPLASISEKSIDLNFTINKEDYKLPSKGKVFITNKEGRELLFDFSEGDIQINYELSPREVSFIEVVPSS
ncbi:DUF6259 domain-containing protein [Kriegella aquimaris]|uniref:DUF6259 domain-containing protein n=1 Tax=Kriegella aquimaris TaxID=192904 RepID=A0A1G9V328_9FLAO|nr:DUF6259 domain-containing protein [Kriegella aquimaris]SDM66446.1 hypothetical protein SAMN04488514_11289 [Kriegella aquimaris]